MEYLIYILAGFGIFSLLVLLLRLLVWCFRCDIDKHFVPIGESEVYTMRSSVVNMYAKETIDQLDQMLDQYTPTKPKVVISRQCICPFCTKEQDKIIINDLNSDYGTEDQIRCFTNNTITEEKEIQTDDNEFDSSYLEVDDIVIIDDSKDEMPCNMYNNVVSELKNRFSSENQTEVKLPIPDTDSDSSDSDEHSDEHANN